MSGNNLMDVSKAECPGTLLAGMTFLLVFETLYCLVVAAYLIVEPADVLVRSEIYFNVFSALAYFLASAGHYFYQGFFWTAGEPWTPSLEHRLSDICLISSVFTLVLTYYLIRQIFLRKNWARVLLSIIIIVNSIYIALTFSFLVRDLSKNYWLAASAYRFFPPSAFLVIALSSLAKIMVVVFLMLPNADRWLTGKSLVMPGGEDLDKETVYDNMTVIDGVQPPQPQEALAKTSSPPSYVMSGEAAPTIFAQMPREHRSHPQPKVHKAMTPTLESATRIEALRAAVQRDASLNGVRMTPPVDPIPMLDEDMSFSPTRFKQMRAQRQSPVSAALTSSRATVQAARAPARPVPAQPAWPPQQPVPQQQAHVPQQQAHVPQQQVHVPQQPVPQQQVHVPQQPVPQQRAYVPQQPVPQQQIHVPQQPVPQQRAYVPQQPVPQQQAHVPQQQAYAPQQQVPPQHVAPQARYGATPPQAAAAQSAVRKAVVEPSPWSPQREPALARPQPVVPQPVVDEPLEFFEDTPTITATEQAAMAKVLAKLPTLPEPPVIQQPAPPQRPAPQAVSFAAVAQAHARQVQRIPMPQQAAAPAARAVAQPAPRAYPQTIGLPSYAQPAPQRVAPPPQAYPQANGHINGHAVPPPTAAMRVPYANGGYAPPPVGTRVNGVNHQPAPQQMPRQMATPRMVAQNHSEEVQPGGYYSLPAAKYDADEKAARLKALREMVERDVIRPLGENSAQQRGR